MADVSFKFLLLDNTAATNKLLFRSLSFSLFLCLYNRRFAKFFDEHFVIYMHLCELQMSSFTSKRNFESYASLCVRNEEEILNFWPPSSHTQFYISRSLNILLALNFRTLVQRLIRDY